jgi:hypothetical protein
MTDFERRHMVVHTIVESPHLSAQQSGLLNG